MIVYFRPHLPRKSPVPHQKKRRKKLMKRKTQTLLMKEYILEPLAPLEPPLPPHDYSVVLSRCQSLSVTSSLSQSPPVFAARAPGRPASHPRRQPVTHASGGGLRLPSLSRPFPDPSQLSSLPPPSPFLWLSPHPCYSLFTS